MRQALAGLGLLAAVAVPPPAEMAFRQHPGAQLPVRATLRDESGHDVRLGDLFERTPVLLVFAYYHCPNLCGLVLGDLFAALQPLAQRPGRDYQLAVIGIDPAETPADAADAKARHLAAVKLPGGASGIHFLTGAAAPVAEIAEAAGFPYRPVPGAGQIAHPAGLLVATAQGRISRYLLGLGYRPRDLRLAIDEAGAGGVAPPAERLLLLCFGYDPAHGRYDLAVGRLMAATGALTLAAVAGLILASARRRRR